MKTYLFILTIFFTHYSIAQGAWTQKKNEKYVQLSFTSINKYKEVFGNPDYLTEREVTDNTLQLYSEYGINNKTTLIINVPLKFIKTGPLVEPFDNPITTSQYAINLGNIGMGIKQQIYNKKWIISGQINVEANTSTYYNSSGIRSGVDAWTFTPTINIGRGYKKYYIQAFTGINIKTNSYSSSFKIGGEIGIKTVKPILLIVFVDVVKSLENGDIQLPVSNTLTSLYVNNQEYGGYGFKIIGKLTKSFGLNAAAGGAFFGNNVAKKIALTFGVYHKF